MHSKKVPYPSITKKIYNILNQSVQFNVTERIYEDHELLVDNLMVWARDSKNKLLFVERQEKNAFFARPEALLVPNNPDVALDERARDDLLDEFFNGSSVAPVEGPLWLKEKRGWRKLHFVLRASGLYFVKGRRELVCLAPLDCNEAYRGLGWRKRLKAPTEHCFGIKHPRLQQGVKFVHLLCAESGEALDRWLTAIRLAKHGRQLLDSFRAAVPETVATPPNHLNIRFEEPFEADPPPVSTIKRKPPSLKPQLPLTPTTRQLTEVASPPPPLPPPEAVVSDEDDFPPPPPPLAPSDLAASVLSLDVPPPPPPPPKSSRRISFAPPPPPPRAAGTRLSTGSGGGGGGPAESAAFLSDLQRVVRRKWQVAEKCKRDTSTSPHEVLGFRDPPPPDYRETNVTNWLAEHYGAALYENVQAVVGGGKQRPPPPPVRRPDTHLTPLAP